MHILTLKNEAILNAKTSVEPGVWVLDDINAAHLMVIAEGGTMEPLTERRPLDAMQDYNGKKILLQRAGGFGDLTLMTPVFREIKRRWPDCTLHVSTMDDYAPVLSNLPYVDATVGYPVARDVLNAHDVWVFFERAIEGNPRARELHMTDLYAEIVGINGDDWAKADKKPDFRLTEIERAWAGVAYPRDKKAKRLAIQVGASAFCRTYPPPLTQHVATMLLQRGWEIFFIGKRGEIDVEEGERFINLSARGHTFRQSCAVLNTADCVLAPDSAMVHIAAALDVPCIGLYGPFPWELRTKYSPSVHALSGHGVCAPCYHHVHLKKVFPEGMPCATAGYCTVLGGDKINDGGKIRFGGGIEPKRIVAKIEQHARDLRNLAPELS